MTATLSAPLKRDRQWDFACVTGPAFYDAQVRHVLLTEGDNPHGAGELPWRTEFGVPLNAVRHAALDAGTLALVRNHVRIAFVRWLPHLRFLTVDVSVLQNVLRVSVGYAAHAAPDAPHRTAVNVGGVARQ